MHKRLSALLTITVLLAYVVSAPPCAAQTGRAPGISVTDLHLEQYVTRDTTGDVVIRNTGTGALIISAITCNDSDFDGGFISIVEPDLPVTLNTSDSVTFSVTLRPNPRAGKPLRDGRRIYTAALQIENSTGIPVASHISGRGHMVDMHTYIDRTYITFPLFTIRVPIVVDEWLDTLGHADMRGLILEMTHYNNTLVRPDSAYNVSGSGFVGTNAAGSQCSENVIETNLQDSMHNFGTQGYYEIDIHSAPQNLGNIGILMRIQLHVLWGKTLDTSELTYVLTFPIDAQSRVMEYINISSSPGLITRDSIQSKVAEIEAPSEVAFSIFPNPVRTSSAVVRIQCDRPSHATVTVHDMVGRTLVCAQYDVDAGSHAYPLDLSHLPPGILAVELRIGNEMYRSLAIRETP
jgi:hypothetical protein